MFVLSQGGEFAFVVFTLANSLSILPEDLNQLLIVVVILSMALTPALAELGDWGGNQVEKWEKEKAELSGEVQLTDGMVDPAAEIAALVDPVVILGFNQYGQVSEERDMYVTHVSEKRDIFVTHMDEERDIYITRVSEERDMYVTHVSEKRDIFVTHVSEERDIYVTNVSEERDIYVAHVSEERDIYVTNVSEERDIFGQVLANMLTAPTIGNILPNKRSFVAFDLEPSRVKAARECNLNVYYGDGSNMALLHAAGITKPSTVCVCYTNRHRTKRAVQHLRAEFGEGVRQIH
jgi:uncharacterized protein YaiI (UPF0178 family)